MSDRQLIDETEENFVVLFDINPEPWAIGTAFAGRRGGAVRGGISPNQKLVIYKKAVADELEMAFSNQTLPVYNKDQAVSLELYFWRQVEPGGNYADVTNLQKAFEDSLQGIIIPNDRQIKRVTATLVEQGPDVEPCIMFRHDVYWQDPLWIKTLKAVIGRVKSKKGNTDNNAW